MAVDLSDAELMEFEVQGKEAMVRIRVMDGKDSGAVLEIRWTINNVWRKGNDPNTGAPNYIINSANPNVRLVSFDKKLRRAGLRQPGPSEGTKGAGVA
ncbi:MAG: hypothetical protein L3K01_02575 [Thermoplasmata archaeon]|nr:hypothetical protein [Thermoplasmata archaeon]